MVMGEAGLFPEGKACRGLSVRRVRHPWNGRTSCRDDAGNDRARDEQGKE